MPKLVSRLNTELNYFDNVQDNIVKGVNGVYSGFYVIHPENIESATEHIRCFKMNQFGSAMFKSNKDLGINFYCLQQTFDFSYEEDRLEKIQNDKASNEYTKKTAEVYKNTYRNITDKTNELRQRTYIMVISSVIGPNKVKQFYDYIINDMYRAGLTVKKADRKTIQKVFNEIFNMPSDNEDLFIHDQEIHFRTSKYLTRNYSYQNEGGEKEIVKDDCYTQIINVQCTSPSFQPLEPHWLSKLFEINDIFVSFNVLSFDERKRDSFLQSLHTDFITVKEKRNKIKNQRMANNREMLGRLMSDVSAGRQDIRSVTILIKITAPNLQKLRVKFEEVKKELNQLGLIYALINFKQHEAIELLQPFMQGTGRGAMSHFQKDVEIMLPTDAIANSYPFIQSSLFQKDGGLFGVSTQGSPIIFNLCDRSKAQNGNLIALGTSGSRKSTANRVFILGQLLNPKNQQLVVVDIENEYTQLAKNFNQQILNFTADVSKDSPTINVFQIAKLDTFDEKTGKFLKEPSIYDKENAYAQQISYVTNFLQIILSAGQQKLETDEISFLSTRIGEVYKKFKINNHTNFNLIPNNKWPTLNDLFNDLDKEVKVLLKKDRFGDLESCKRLVRLLKPYTDQSNTYNGLFNRHTNIDIGENYKMVVFNLYGLFDKEMPDQVKTALLIRTLYFCRNIMLAQRKRFPKEKDPNAKYVTFVFDEFHKLVDDRYPDGLKILSQMYSQLRKYYSQIVVTTQSLATFTKAQNADIKRYLEQILNNSQYKLIFGMTEEQMSEVNDRILYDQSRLTDNERTFLATSSNVDGGKFILYLSNKERIAGRVYSAYTNALDDNMVHVPFEEITEPIQIWQSRK